MGRVILGLVVFGANCPVSKTTIVLVSIHGIYRRKYKQLFSCSTFQFLLNAEAKFTRKISNIFFEIICRLVYAEFSVDWVTAYFNSVTRHFGTKPFRPIGVSLHGRQGTKPFPPPPLDVLLHRS